MNKFVICSIIFLIGIVLLCGCTTVSTLPATLPTTTVPLTSDTTTVPTTWSSTTYSSYLYDFTVGVPEGWEQESLVGGIGFYTDNKRWLVMISSLELDEPISFSDLEGLEILLVNSFESGFSPENGYSEYETKIHYTTTFTSPDWTSYPELYIEFTCTLNGVEMWGDCYFIFTYDRSYNIMTMCEYDRLFADEYLYLEQSSDFYWTFEPSYHSS